ncbi:hypothetical protein N7918_25565 [Klebsiella michiganensis]|nr:hypothetical protein N7918_25565 [Klebsiella michiganensis]
MPFFLSVASVFVKPLI